MTLIYAKTRKGHDEMVERTGGLTLRVRRLLIFIDGKHTNEELQAMAGGVSFTESIEFLRASGYIEELSKVAMVVAEIDADAETEVEFETEAVPTTATVTTPTDADPQVRDVVRELMLNSLSEYTGSLKYRALMRRIRHEITTEGLRQLSDEWYEAINDNPDASLVAEELKTRILDVLEGLPPR